MTSLDPNDPQDIPKIRERQRARIEETRKAVRQAAHEADIKVRTEARETGLSGGYVKATPAEPHVLARRLYEALEEAGLDVTYHTAGITTDAWVGVNLVPADEEEGV